jgi:hypothetical protein
VPADGACCDGHSAAGAAASVAWDPSWLTAPLLGSGSFGDVRAGTVRPYGPVAIKLPREFGSVRAFRDEVAALAAVGGGGGHANVVQVYAVAIEPVDRPHVAIIMRRWKTTLHAVLHIEGGGRPPWRTWHCTGFWSCCRHC